MVRVCFVCLGNICRSPTAEAVMRQLVEREGLGAVVHVESAGTGDWHVGDAPDPRSRAAAARRGVHLNSRGQHFTRRDWDRFDHVLAMDERNHADLARTAPPGAEGTKLRLFRSFDPASPPGASVPDPYYSEDGFDEVLDLCFAACEGLLGHLRKEHGLVPPAEVRP